MTEGGPATAIEVCSKEAAIIAEQVGAEQGVAIGRTSFKLRNAKNTPPEWARPLVQQRVAERGMLIYPPEQSEALLPIRLQAICLTCHGPADRIAEDVRLALAKTYPDDQATGFAEGDLRGWFWVEVPADD